MDKYLFANDEAQYYHVCWSYWNQLEVMNPEWFRLIFNKREAVHQHILAHPFTKSVEYLGVLKIGDVQISVVFHKQEGGTYLAARLFSANTLAPEDVVIETISLSNTDKHSVYAMQKNRYAAIKINFV